jgi:hypothetical protein
MVEIGRFETRDEAERARTLLAAAGIPSLLTPDEAGSDYPMRDAGGARLFVAEADAEAAAAILRSRLAMNPAVENAGPTEVGWCVSTRCPSKRSSRPMSGACSPRYTPTPGPFTGAPGALRQSGFPPLTKLIRG